MVDGKRVLALFVDLINVSQFLFHLIQLITHLLA